MTYKSSLLKRLAVSAAVASMTVAAMFSSIPAHAQSVFPAFAASDGKNLFIYPQGAQPVQVTQFSADPANYSSIFSIAYAPDGATVVFTTSEPVPTDKTSYRSLLHAVPAAGGTPTVIAENLAIEFPVTFDAAGNVLFAQNTDMTNLTNPDEYKVVLKTIAPTGGTATTVAEVPYGVGCGGGTSIPADMAYNNETSSLGGSGLTLATVAGGYIYSPNCVGAGINFLAEGGTTVIKLNEKLARVAVSPDKTRIAGITFTYSNSGPTDVQLSVLTQDQVTPPIGIKTTKPVDQLTWLNDDEIIYSTIENLGTIFTADELAKITTGMGYGADSTGMADLVQNRQVTIRRINIITGEDIELYATDPKPEAADNAYAIGRLIRLNDGRVAYSLIPGVNGWARMVADGKTSYVDSNFFTQTDKLFPIGLYVLDPATKAITQIGAGLEKVAVSPK